MIAKWYPNREDPQIGVFIQKHARAIARYNHVAVLFVHGAQVLPETFLVEQSYNDNLTEIKVYYRKNESVFAKLINGWRFTKAALKGIGLLEEALPFPEFVHAYILLRPALLARFIARRKKIPMIVSEQWSGYLNENYRRKSTIQKYLSRYLSKKAAAIHCVSGILAKRMKEHGLLHEPYYIIPNIVEKIESPEVKRIDDYVHVLLVADLVDDIKNISAVIRMVGQVKTDIPFQLKIIGAGIDEIMLKNLASSLGLLDDKVFFEGLKANMEVYEYLVNSDFLIMNSKVETFSLICAEAMSCGKPVIATRCGGPDEFVIPMTGILIDPGSEEQLKDAFLKMLLTHHQYDSEGIRKYAYELFSIDHAGASFQKLYISVNTPI